MHYASIEKRILRKRRLARKKYKRYFKLILTLILIVVFCAGIAYILWYIKYQQIQKQIASSATPVPPTTVTAIQVIPAQWNNHLKAIGTLVATQGIGITGEVSGIVKTINFESGQQADQDQLLLSLRNETELAVLHTAQAELSSSSSQYQRSLKLKNEKFVTENELDLQRLAVEAAISRVEMAKANLEKKQIIAPFSGKLGIRMIDVGDYISPGTKLVSLQSIDKLYLDFTLPERNFKELETGQFISFKVRSYPKQVFQGKVQAWDPILDANTRNVNVRAVVENQENLLAPGMFAEVEVDSSDVSLVYTIPETSIFYNIYGEAVYILENNNDVAKTSEDQPAVETFILATRKVRVLYRENGIAGVIEGLQQGDKVVTSGQLKLYPSLKVIILNDVLGSNSPQAVIQSPIQTLTQ